jgi:hypothetical protein
MLRTKLPRASKMEIRELKTSYSASSPDGVINRPLTYRY